MIKAGFIGCVESSRAALQTLLEVDGLKIAAVVTRNGSAVNADFCNLTDLCQENGVPFTYEDPGARENSVCFFESFDLDIIFCVGWSYILSERMLALPRQGVIGYHPASLPSNRGRHPIIWALTLGLEETASTLFFMDHGADSGPIVSQVPVSIESSDNATDLYKKMIDVLKIQLIEIGSELVAGTLTSKKQDHSRASYWRKRSRKDGTIDFRMNAATIHNLVRALAPPYPGAEFIFQERYISVNRSLISKDFYRNNIEPGKVLSKTGCDLLVKAAGNQAIWLLDVDCSQINVGDYL